jgi:hypothetical protein
MEERLWDHIDGLGNTEERAEIERLIATDSAWKNTFESLLDTQRLLRASELEQPSMRFTRNVMDSITSLQVAPPTRSYINKRIIWGIGAFFGITILTSLVWLISSFKFGSGGRAPVKLPMPDMSTFSHIPSSVWTVFLIADAMLGLLFLDRYMRKRQERRTV